MVKVLYIGDRMQDIIRNLDKIANVLESKGLLKEALELDIISNTIEAFDAQRSAPYRNLDQLLDLLRSNDIRGAQSVIQRLREPAEGFYKGYGQRTAPNGRNPAKEFYETFKILSDMVGKGDVNNASQAIMKMQQNLKDLKPIIEDYTGNKPAPQNTPQTNAPQKGVFEKEFFVSAPKKKGLFQKIFK